MMRVRVILAAALCGVCVVSTDAGAGERALVREAVAQTATPTHVQAADALVSVGANVSATFANPTTAGNLIVAYAVWDNAGSVTLSDSAGNVYTPAGVGRTAWAGSYSAQVFYAKNVRGGATTVTATFSSPALSFGILYIHEYSGLDTANPLDVAAAVKGSGKAMSSPAVTTTNAADLIFGAGSSIGAVTKGGTGFTVRSTKFGNITEDRNVAALGSYKATATHTGGGWVMQVVAFKAAETAADTTPPTIPTNLNATAVSASQINLAWTPSTDNVGVAGYNIFRDGVQVATSTQPSYHDTGRAASMTYSYEVSAFDAAANTSAPSISASATTPAEPTPTDCALPNYPTPECTGVPAGTTFVRVIDGTYTANTPGEVIDRWLIKGSLIVNADNVLITNSQIDDTVTNNPEGAVAHPFTIMDSTVGPELCGTRNWMPNGVGFEQYTAIRVKVRGHEDGFRAAGPNVTVRDSFYRACVDAESHSDGIQDYPSAQNVVFEHNTMDMANLTMGFNAPIYINSNETVGARITDNLVLGGVYSLYLNPRSGVWIVTGNRIVNNTWAFGASETGGLCANVTTWDDNTIVTIDASYRITSTVRTEPCPR